MRNNFLLIVLIMALIPLTSYSQDNKKKQFTVAGVVIDKTGEPLPGTTIYVKNAPGVGTSADMDGKFSIKVDANQILVIQAIGMKSIEKLVTKDEMTLKVTLEEDDTKLDEVVVTGMTSQKKISVVGAISTIDVAAQYSRYFPQQHDRRTVGWCHHHAEFGRTGKKHLQLLDSWYQYFRSQLRCISAD